MDEAKKLLHELSTNPDALNNITNYDEAIRMYKMLNPYGQQVNPKASDYTCLSYIPMRDEHIHRISLVSIIGYIYRAYEEYEDLFNISDFVKSQPRYAEIIKKNKKVVKDFLDCIFEYNPEKDVQSSYVPPEVGSRRTSLKCDSKGHPYPIVTDGIGMEGCNCQSPVDRKELYSELSDINALLLEVKHNQYNSGSLNSGSLNSAQSKLNALMDKVQCMNNRVNNVQEKYGNIPLDKMNSNYTTLNGICDDKQCKCRKLSTCPVPSRDLFARLTRYSDNNWEKIVKMASDLYVDKIDIESAIQVHKHFKTLESASNYEKENGIKVCYPIITVKDGPWILLTPCAANKNNTSFDASSELKDILDRGNKEKKLVKEMVAKRVVKQVKKNILENQGEYDREGIDKYAKTSGMGNGKTLLTEEDKAKLDEFVSDYKQGKIDQRLLYENVDVDGVPLDAVQIDVIETDGKTVKKYPMYTKVDWDELKDDEENKDSEENELRELKYSSSANVSSVSNNNPVSSSMSSPVTSSTNVNNTPLRSSPIELAFDKTTEYSNNTPNNTPNVYTLPDLEVVDD
jgi:hypothetical protein